MKVLHLSDLHFGKRLNGCSLLEDQEYITRELIALADDADAVLIAGDLYDKSAPSGEAVALCDRFLTGLSGKGKPVLIISGNHDSPQRVAFGAQLMEKSRVYIAPVFHGEISPVVLKDEWGEVAFWLLPFLKPAHIRAIDPQAEITTSHDAVAWALNRMRPGEYGRNVLVAHQFVSGAKECDSEELNIGGLDQVDASLFDAFDYVALGHLHTPQCVGRETVRYSGSPLKYSFSEAEQQKEALFVELRAPGEVLTRSKPLHPLRDMIRLKGTFSQLMQNALPAQPELRYAHITLTDEQDVPQAMSRLRGGYPNLLGLSYDNLRTRSAQTVATGTEEHLTPEEWIAAFYRLQNNQGLCDEQRAYLSGLIRQIWEVEL